MAAVTCAGRALISSEMMRAMVSAVLSKVGSSSLRSAGHSAAPRDFQGTPSFAHKPAPMGRAAAC